MSNSLDKELKKIIPNTITKRRKTINLGFCFGLCAYIFSVKKQKHILYDFLKRYINEKLDVIFYLKTLEKFDRIRVLLFNYYQNLCLDHIKIPNLSQDELTKIDLDLQDKNISHEELVEYFNFRIKNKEMDEFDEQLLKIVTPEIQNLVKSRD